MNRFKKLGLRIFIILYAVSYILQNSFFIDWRKVYAAENPSMTKLVAIFVDKDIYSDIRTNLVRYTTKYIQQKIANSKAIVLPIDTSTLKAHEISQILENMYFEGVKDESSKLIGTILIGNIPLPVVENNGFIYPSIYPYVDFENQQFIYDTNKWFFVYNDNPKGQAEIWHSIIKFDTPAQYNNFFEKVKSYYNNPTNFINKAIRYEDFIWMKKYFIPENTKYYVNSLTFTEDIGYHRFTNLMLNIMKDEHNESAIKVGKDLNDGLQDTDDPDLQAYAQDITSRSNEANTLAQQSTSQMPTMTLSKATEEMLKGYDGLFSSQFLAKIKDNIWGLARRYKTTDNETFTDYSSLTNKITQKDNRILGDTANNIQPLLIQLNNYLEQRLDDKIQEEKYYLTIPIPLSELDFEWDIKIPASFRTPVHLPLPSCIRKKYNYYENYYFGQNASRISNAQELSIYRGTYQNLTTISGQNITTNPRQSIGGSYNIFSTQIEANKGYNFNNTKDELALYNKIKINKQELRSRDCKFHLFGYCILRQKTRKAQDSANQDKCYIDDPNKQWWCESIQSFTQRIRWGASPMNIDATTKKLANYNYKNAIYPIYDIAGSQSINTPEPANTYTGIETYTALIQKRFAANEKQENKYTNIASFITNPHANGIDLKFTNQIPNSTNLEHPTWVYNPPKTYANNDFFTIYNIMPSHMVYAGKMVLYTRTNPTDIGNCNVKGHIYTYKTIDSRIKNTSPTWNQISNTDIYKFKNGSDLEIFYKNVMEDLSLIQTDIANKTNEFSGTSSTDMTGVIPNLIQIKNMVTSGNNGIQEILTFNYNTLTSMSATQIANKANDRTNKNLNPTKLSDLTGKIAKVNNGLNTLLDYLNNLTLNTTATYIDNIIQSENFKKQKVEILNTRKSDFMTNLDAITTRLNVFKSAFASARGIYNTIGTIQDSTASIQAQRNNIANLQWGDGCTANYYKAICDVLDGIIALQTNIVDTNDQIDKIHSYPGDNGQVQPFVEINWLFSSWEIFSDIVQTKTTINTFDVSNDPDKKEKNKGMNLTTQDRPIDNIRNITFKGVWGDPVRLNYPNLYEVEIYKEVGSKLVLKTPEEIREALKTYLINKAVEYNTILETQMNKKNQYYQSFNAQFNFLGTFDALANPNTHNYNLLPTDYFIGKLIEYLDTLANGYGTKAIYGQDLPTSTDDKLAIVAKLLYYQNITWPERMKQETVAQDIAEIKDSFDINQKINHVIDTYLVEDNDQGKFLTPTYESTGYEIGYINSDGEDYISSKPVPAFIQQIQKIQENTANTKHTPTNTFIETPISSSSAAQIQKESDKCDGVDVNGTALLFDLKTFSSPWIKAMACRAKTIKHSLDIKIWFKHALGPVFVGNFNEIKDIITGTGSWDGTGGRLWQRWTYGDQRTVPNNEDIINQSSDDIRGKLQGYNTYSIVNLKDTIINVEDTGTNEITIGMAQDVGPVNVKISGVGDNCFQIRRKGKQLSSNICKKDAKEYYNPYTDNVAFDIIMTQKKAGSTAIRIKLCPWTSNVCITKQQVVNIVPGPVQTIRIQTDADPQIVMEGGEIPMIVTANDAYGNEIKKSIQAYTISVANGGGKISDGASSNNSITFDTFPATFIYQAPKGLSENRAISVNIQKASLKQPTEKETQEILVQKNITIVPGIITITKNNIVLYKTDVPQINQPKITFNLPKDESAIQYKDNEGIAQIVPVNIPSITITVKDKNGNLLNTVANINSKQGILIPGIIKGIQTPFTFSQANDFIIKDGKIDIALYPSFKAGDDELTINMPGIKPIIIPITVYPGPAKKVLMNLKKNKLDLTTNTTSEGTIQVVDTWNNIVTSGTTIKLGVIGAADIPTNEFEYSGKEYTYTITAKSPGGEGYVFAYIKDRQLSDQIPGYQRFIVQDTALPRDKLNIMYLNLFGTDRGNQRWYFSENKKIVNTITSQSNKLLATTTELVDPNKIKQIAYIVHPNGQIRSIKNKNFTLTVINKTFTVQLPEIADISLWLTKDFTLQKLADSWALNEINKNKNLLIYIPEPTDSIITENTTTQEKIVINGNTVFDKEKGEIDPNITIVAENEMRENMTVYTISFNGKNIGKLILRNNNSIDDPAVHIKDPITYNKTTVFSEGSTNSQGIGIYLQSSAFTKQGYESIEDSSDAMLGIGFTSKFKNIANFANGKMVGEATLPYGSHFLVNFWDPLLERREKNPEIPNTNFDASLGQTIYADPDKTIFKVLPIDFNNDGIKDIIVAYTDGSIKLLKNYGGKEPYQNLQELMIVAEPIKDIKIGDLDGNNYEDILIITNNNKGIAYLNKDGVFSVDGKNICLNVNTENITETPEDFSGIKQLFVEDMDRDGKLDIVTNDELWDIKIFYGGTTNGWVNYVSLITGTCDAQWYERQKNNYKILKRFGIKINGSRYIQDNSLIHRKGMTIPVEGVEEEVDEETPDTTAGMSSSDMETVKIQTLNKIKDMVANTDQYIAAGSTQLAYTDNPLSTSPIYESLSPSEVYYLPINEINDAVSVYKEYQDINGNILRKGDEVVVKTTLISKKNNNKLTYIDQLRGPRSIAKDKENKIPSLVFLTNNTENIKINRDVPEEYQFVMDNIVLNSGDILSFSYTIKYIPETASAVSIHVQDQDLIKKNKYKDTYPDIRINSTDACQKNRWILFNKKIGNKRIYEEIFDDIQATINAYNSWAQATQQTAINSMIDQLGNVDSLESISSIAGMDTTEPRSNTSLINMINTIVSPGGGSLNVNMNFIDSATANVSKKIDTALQGLCQGFKIGKNGCQGVPVPFNQAFLAPGDYHIFWCVPKAPNPLYPVFTTLNKTIGKGIPTLTIPGNRPTPAGVFLPIPGIFWLPVKGPTDGYFLGVQWWILANSSLFRLYIVPTLTLGLGMAMCFWPYGVGVKLPKPFRDMGGNCIVFALPPLTSCSSTNEGVGNDEPSVETYDPSIAAAADVGTCNNPPKFSNTIVFVPDTPSTTNTHQNNGEQVIAGTTSSPLQLVAAGSEENNPHYSIAIPQGNFWWLVNIDQDPISVSAEENYGTNESTLDEGYQLEKGENINLKIVGAKTKGLVKCVVQDWMTRQIQYIQNNLTKMTIQLDLPDLSTIFQGFDKIGNLEATYKELQKQDTAEWYIQKLWTGEKGVAKREEQLSKQQLKNISETVGENPFQAIQEMFKEVPLINIDSKDINIQIPALTSEDINGYINYLTLRVDKAETIIKDRWDFFNQMNALCAIQDIKGNLNNINNINKQITDLETIKNPTDEQKQALNSLKKLKKNIEICLKMDGQINKFITFRENSAGLIRSIKQNIIVLQKYKQFPTQLYERTHITDRYLTEISALLSDFIGSINYRLSTNANRFSQYVDAITLMVWAIKTRQAIIDFSVNRSEKCSKCSNDNYGSFSCSLSFLCPKLPIFPIPAFKIPNIYMDLSHIELGMNLTLPKINFVPIKIPLPQIPNLPEPPSVEVDWDILYGLDINFFKDMSLPTIPVIPEPPQLPEPPSFIPSIKIDLPVLPPAPKIPKILPEINGILKVADFIGKVFCIVKWGIGLVGEKGVKGKVEQITQRTREVPVFDFFNLTTKYKDPPLQGFDYKLDAYATLKFNFDGVYDVFNTIAQSANSIVSQKIEAPIQEGVDRTTEKANNNRLTTGANAIENFDQNINPNINLNVNGYLPKEETSMLDYQVAYNKLKQGLLQFSNFTLSDKVTNDKIQTIIATVDNTSNVLPATKQIENVEKAAQGIINEKKKENSQLKKEIQNYDNFIKKLKGNVVLVDSKTTKSTLSTAILTIDSHTKNILQSQEDPTKTYLTLNKQMVDGYLKAVDNNSAENLNMSKSTYNKSKQYLETTKEKIDTALLAYEEGSIVAQNTCTNCSNQNQQYSTDISAYVQGVFVESYSGTEKNLVNTVTSPEHVTQVKKTYTTDTDLNNDGKKDILMYDTNTIYIKYAQQNDESLSKWGNSLTTKYTKRYSYANEHPGNILNPNQWYIKSLDQLRNNSDTYGYTTINDLTFKIVDKNKEVKWFSTKGQNFSTLQLWRKNSQSLGENVDGYIIKVHNKIDTKDRPSSFWQFLGIGEKPKYIVVLPKGTDYKKWLLTIDNDYIKKPINLELGDRILAVEYYDPAKEDITLSFKDLPREWLYINIATLTITQDDLSTNQQKSLILYKKSSPWSNQTVAGMQNLGDIEAPVGEIVLRRNMTNEAIGTGVALEGYINTKYTLKSTRTDNVIVSKMLIQKDGQIIAEKDNQSQTGILNLSGLFFTGTDQQNYDFIAIDQNGNIAKETVTLKIMIPDIQIIDLKKSGEDTADIIAKISNDIDEGQVIFQRLRNGIRSTIKWSNQNSYEGFDLSPKQTIITWGIFTISNNIGLYDTQGNEVATIDPKTGEIKVNQGYENKIQIYLRFWSHIPVIEVRDRIENRTLFQIVLPVQSITDIAMQSVNYQKVQLPDGQFGDFSNGYCIMNMQHECILYTNNAGAMYIPWTYATSLIGEYAFDKTNKNVTFTIKEQSGTTIAKIILKVKSTEN